MSFTFPAALSLRRKSSSAPPPALPPPPPPPPPPAVVAPQQLALAPAVRVGTTLTATQLNALVADGKVTVRAPSSTHGDELVRTSDTGALPVQLSPFLVAANELAAELGWCFSVLGACNIAVSVDVHAKDARKLAIKAAAGINAAGKGKAVVASSSESQTKLTVTFSASHSPLAELSEAYRASWAYGFVTPELKRAMDSRFERLLEFAKEPTKPHDVDAINRGVTEHTFAFSPQLSSSLSVPVSVAKKTRAEERHVEVGVNVEYYPPWELRYFDDLANRQRFVYGTRFSKIIDALGELEEFHAADAARYGKEKESYDAAEAAAAAAAAKASYFEKTWAFFSTMFEPEAEAVPPIKIVKPPVSIFLMGPPGAGKSSWLWAIRQSVVGAWTRPEGINVRFLPPNHEVDGTETNVDVEPITGLFGTVLINSIDQKGGTPLRDYDASNPLHVCVFVAPAAMLWAPGTDKADAEDVLKKWTSANQPHVILVTKFDELGRGSAGPGAATTDLLASINASSRNWGAAEWFCEEYRTMVAAPTLRGDVKVVPVETPVRLCEGGDTDPRKLDADELRVMHQRALKALLVVLEEAVIRVKRNVKVA